MIKRKVDNHFDIMQERIDFVQVQCEKQLKENDAFNFFDCDKAKKIVHNTKRYVELTNKYIPGCLLSSLEYASIQIQAYTIGLRLVFDSLTKNKTFKITSFNKKLDCKNLFGHLKIEVKKII
jgi:hypothetical protein